MSEESNQSEQHKETLLTEAINLVKSINYSEAKQFTAIAKLNLCTKKQLIQFLSSDDIIAGLENIKLDVEQPEPTPEPTVEKSPKEILELKIKSKTKKLHYARKEYAKAQADFNEKTNHLAKTLTLKENKSKQLLKELQELENKYQSI